MKKLLEIYKEEGLNNLINEIEQRNTQLENKINELNNKVELLEIGIEFNSAIYVQAGSAIQPFELLDTYFWKAEDLTEFVVGLGAITYSGKLVTRWALDNVKTVKFNLPLNRSDDHECMIVLSNAINEKVLSSIAIFIDAVKVPMSFIKSELGYSQKFKIKAKASSRNTVISLAFNNFIEDGKSHTLGISTLEVL